jgi:hypothetical protein
MCIEFVPISSSSKALEANQEDSVEKSVSQYSNLSKCARPECKEAAMLYCAACTR